MSVAGADPEKHEILIIKRHGGDHEDGHHGGAWKIAFADFMTAMMCFFLVMWLINASNEQTKASVASYFNPVKLIDRNSSRKGLEDIGDGPNSTGTDADEPETREKAGAEGIGQTGPAKNSESRDATDAQDRSDESLFADPYAVLAEIAAETGELQNISSKGEGGAQDSGPATGASGGESYRDPFAPDFWSQQVESSEAALDIIDQSATAEATADAEPEKGLAPGAEPAPDGVPAPPSQAAVKVEEPDVTPPSKTEATEKAIQSAETIKEAIAGAFSKDNVLADNIEVTVKDGAVIISVTDQLDFGMFEIGSALPRAELVRAMEKIGKIVAGQPGEVTINGHTDARPFRSREYDNWRLSSARAQSAYYMLVRGGLDEGRVKQVAGFADRALKLPNDPLSASNRRIEILLETKP